jgi:transcriptional regulator with XRE-family HTH domain
MSANGISFSDLLTRFRTERGWSQGRLALIAGFDPSTVSRLESGARAPERETVDRLADAMALPMADRDAMLAAAGFRSAAWDDPLLAELVQILSDPTLPDGVADEVRTAVKVAVLYGRSRARRA